MIRAQSGDQIGVAPVLRQPLGHLFQKRVPGWTAKTVVNVLEPVQIDQHYGDLVPTVNLAAHILSDTLEKQSAVRQPGQLIIIGEVF